MLKADTLIHQTSTSVPHVQPVEGVPTRIDVAFTNHKGVEKRAIRKAAERALKQLAPTLQRFLTADEFVVYAAGGCAPMTGVEQWTFGYFAQFVSRVTLVFTNKRLLAFRVTSNGRWRKNWRACSLGDIHSAKLSGFLVSGYLKLQYLNGKKETYWALKMRDKSKLKLLMPKLLEANRDARTPVQGMQALCPSCGAVLPDRQYECNGCGQRFRDETSLWWRSVVPGGGYFYVNQPGMGVLHAVVDSLIGLEFLLTLYAAVTAKPVQRTTEFWIGFSWIAFLFLFERSITTWHARRLLREFIPIDGTARADQARAAGA